MAGEELRPGGPFNLLDDVGDGVGLPAADGRVDQLGYRVAAQGHLKRRVAGVVHSAQIGEGVGEPALAERGHASGRLHGGQDGPRDGQPGLLGLRGEQVRLLVVAAQRRDLGLGRANDAEHERLVGLLGQAAGLLAQWRGWRRRGRPAGPS